jgi:hypothetical protein
MPLVFTRWRREATFVTCMKIPAADSMKPNKLKRHLKTVHVEYVGKHLNLFTGN